MNLERTGVKKPNIVLFVSCIIGAVVGGIVAEILYKQMLTDIPVILQVGIYFSIVILGISILAFVSELVVSRSKSVWTGNEIARSCLLIFASILVFGLLGMLFQFIYGLGYANKHIKQFDDYLFVIDNSSSTDTSDPSDLRFSEVEGFIEGLDENNRFSVEVFDHTIVGKLPLNDVNDQSKQELLAFDDKMKKAEKGGTELQLVLSDVIDNYVPDGRTAAVILLSDGESNSAVDFKLLGNTYQTKSVPIFSVAFSNIGSLGIKTLTELAERTDGYYCEIDDLRNLKETVNNMIELTSRRSLLERRRGSDVSNILAMILRILFISLLGIVVEIVLTLILDYEELLRSGMLIHIPFSILAGITAEVVIRILPSGFMTRLLMDILMAVVVASYMKYTYTLPEGENYSDDEYMTLDNTYERSEPSVLEDMNSFDEKELTLKTMKNSRPSDLSRNKWRNKRN